MLYLLLNSAAFFNFYREIVAIKSLARCAMENAMETQNLLRNSFAARFLNSRKNARALFSFYFSSISTWHEDSRLKVILKLFGFVQFWVERSLLDFSLADSFLIKHWKVRFMFDVWRESARIPINQTAVKMTKIFTHVSNCQATRVDELSFDKRFLELHKKISSCARRWRNVLKTIISLIKIISSSSKGHQLSTSSC